jgi:hypothetical protein
MGSLPGLGARPDILGWHGRLVCGLCIMARQNVLDWRENSL